MSEPVKLSGWLLSIPASLALHAIPLALVLWLVTPQLESVFIVDLTEGPEQAPVQPRPSESRPAGVRNTAPARPRAAAPRASSARNEAPAESTPPSPPVAVTTREPTPRPVEPPAARPQELTATPISPTPPPAAATPEPMPQVAESPPHVKPAIDAVFAVPPAASIERDSPAPFAAPSSPTTARSIEAPAPAATRGGPGGADARQPEAGKRTAALGGGAGDGGEAAYRAYLALVRQRILEALRYPPDARQRGLVGTVYLEIVVQPNGAISDVTIVTPSSHPILDRAALETVRSLPSIGFPPGLAPRQLRARLPVMFNLR